MYSSIPAPVALFVYKRASHTINVLKSLSNCLRFPETTVYIFSDGPKTKAEQAAVADVRAILKQQKYSNLIIVEREKNWGLANSIITGVTELCEQFGEVIVLEDDLEVSPYFLEYMNAALTKYANYEHVLQVSGYMFPVELTSNKDAVFLPFTTSWGWATWSRAWKYFDAEVKAHAILAADASLQRKFDLEGSYPYYKALIQQQQGKLNSWAIRWYLSVFMRHGLVLYPTRTLVRNNGFDGTGTNWKASELVTETELSSRPIKLFPEIQEIDVDTYSAIVHYLRRHNNPVRKLLRRILAKFQFKTIYY